MTDPEETNEELSTDELKSVSGGISAKDLAGNSFTSWPGLGDAYLRSPQGSGSGMTVQDWKKSKKDVVQSTLGDGDGAHE